MKKLALVVGLAATLFATAAEAMTVQEFLTAAARIPRNPTALLRADTRRLIAEIRTASETIGNEREAAIAAGRRPAFCPPGGRASVSADDRSAVAAVGCPTCGMSLPPCLACCHSSSGDWYTCGQ